MPRPADPCSEPALQQQLIADAPRCVLCEDANVIWQYKTTALCPRCYLTEIAKVR